MPCENFCKNYLHDSDGMQPLNEPTERWQTPALSLLTRAWLLLPGCRKTLECINMWPLSGPSGRYFNCQLQLRASFGIPQVSQPLCPA